MAALRLNNIKTPTAWTVTEIGKEAIGLSPVMFDFRTPLNDDKAPEFPQMSGLLWDLAQAMFPDIPLAFKFMSLVTYWGLIRSGMDVIAGVRNLQTRFYTCLVSDQPWVGKGAATNEAERCFLPHIPPTMLVAKSTDSAPALCDDFADLRKQSPMAERLQILMQADEMTDLFEKAKTTNQSRNTMNTTLLSMFETTSIANRARHANKGQRIQIDIAHLAVLGGATKDGYSEMWQKTGGGANGLQSRFVPIYVDAKPFPAIQRESTAETAGCLLRLAELLKKPAQTIRLTNESEKVLTDWWEQYATKPRASVIRILDIVKRMIIVLAVTNEQEDLLAAEGIIYVEPSLVEMACRWGDYVIKCRELLNPTDAYTFVQQFENGITECFRRHQGRPLTKREVRQLLHVNRKPGGIDSFRRAWTSLWQEGDIVRVGVNSGRKELFELAKEAIET